MLTPKVFVLKVGSFLGGGTTHFSWTLTWKQKQPVSLPVCPWHLSCGFLHPLGPTLSSAASPRSPQHIVSAEQHIGVLLQDRWSKEMPGLGSWGLGPGLLIFFAFFLTTSPSASLERLESFQVLLFFWAPNAEAQ